MTTSTESTRDWLSFLPKLDSAARYQKQKTREADKARHQSIVGKLSKDVTKEFDQLLDTIQPDCRDNPLPYMDWDDDDELQPNAPNKMYALILCEECPLFKMDNICKRYAEATSQPHGVWGGEVIVNGEWRK